MTAALRCARHPLAVNHGRYCAACLLEAALSAGGDNATNAATARQDWQSGQLTILMPLGKSAATSIFLVRMDRDTSRLLRLKRWHFPAASDFLARFHELEARFQDWPDGQIDGPIAAAIDATGCPSVLSEFRQGIPILEGVRSGALEHRDALARLASLTEFTRIAHRRGLIHGSIVAGNVIVQRGAPAAWLLDFGLASVLRTSGDVPLAAADLVGFSELARIVGEIRPSRLPERV